MRRFTLAILLFGFAVGCHKELYDECPPKENVIDIKIIDLLPDFLDSFQELTLRSASLSFYSMAGGNPIHKKITGNSGNITLTQGHYSVFIYSSDFFELDAIFYRGMDKPQEAEAYSRKRTEDGELIVGEPDPLFCAYVENFSVDAPRELISIVLRPLVFTYRFRIYIEGIEYLSSASAKVTGMYPSVFMKDGTHREKEPASMYIPIKITHTDAVNGYLYGEFRSYGSHQGANVEHRISIALTNGGTTKIVELDDLTHTIKALPTGGEIEITQKLVLKNQPGEPEDGFNPGVNDWDDVEIPIPI